MNPRYVPFGLLKSMLVELPILFTQWVIQLASKAPPEMSSEEETKPTLWAVPKVIYDDKKYSDHLMEQYKLFCQLADSHSARRGATNRFLAS